MTDGIGTCVRTKTADFLADKKSFGSRVGRHSVDTLQPFVFHFLRGLCVGLLSTFSTFSTLSTPSIILITTFVVKHYIPKAFFANLFKNLSRGGAAGCGGCGRLLYIYTYMRVYMYLSHYPPRRVTVVTVVTVV